MPFTREQMIYKAVVALDKAQEALQVEVVSRLTASPPPSVIIDNNLPEDLIENCW
jgi:hypothetical protein